MMMTGVLKNSMVAVAAIALSMANVTTHAANPVKTFRSKHLQSSDAAIIDQLSILCTKQLRASALAANQGGTQVRGWAERLSSALTTFNEEIRTLAKSKKIMLSTTFSENSLLRADGRVDATPENLKDTARINNTGGEAGNSGAVKTRPIGINHEANNVLIESLKKLKGEPFNRAYKNLLISDKPVAEKLLNQISKSTDTEIAAFGKKYLKILNQAKR